LRIIDTRMVTAVVIVTPKTTMNREFQREVR